MMEGTLAADGGAVTAAIDAPPERPEWPEYCNPRYVMPATIQVMVPGVDGRSTRMPVSVAKALVGSKPYLGGYKHKQTGFLYHHASSQTSGGSVKREGWLEPEKKTHRDTQTCVTKTRSMMTGREFGTQMKRADLLLDDTGDQTVVSRPYFSAKQLEELKRQNTVIIQCYWRGYVARKLTWGIREALYNDYVEQQQALTEAAEGEAKRREYEVARRMNPKKAQDFELLYDELEAWVKKEVRDMNSEAGLSDSERRERMGEILAKQTKALQTIDRLKLEASKQGREKRVGKMLQLMAKPKLWELGNGEVQEVHTQFTVRAAELMDLYQGLLSTNTDAANSASSAMLDERLDVLLNVKWTVREFDCTLTRDIVDLCDREAEMMNRGRNSGTLSGLRKRLANLFLQFIETPDFNPEAFRYLKAPGGANEQQKLMSLTA